MLSTSKITTDRVNNFLKTGDLKVAKKGMGKIKLLGSINTANLVVDGSQVIIKDIVKLGNKTFIVSDYLFYSYRLLRDCPFAL